MAGSGRSRANENRAIRQEALREQLSAQGHVQHAFDIVGKLANLSEHMDSVQVQRLGKAMDGHFKFINKYLPDVKAVEISGADGENLAKTFSEMYAGTSKDG